MHTIACHNDTCVCLCAGQNGFAGPASTSQPQEEEQAAPEAPVSFYWQTLLSCENRVVFCLDEAAAHACMHAWSSCFITNCRPLCFLQTEYVKDKGIVASQDLKWRHQKEDQVTALHLYAMLTCTCLYSHLPHFALLACECMRAVPRATVHVVSMSQQCRNEGASLACRLAGRKHGKGACLFASQRMANYTYSFLLTVVKWCQQPTYLVNLHRSVALCFFLYHTHLISAWCPHTTIAECLALADAFSSMQCALPLHVLSPLSSSHTEHLFCLQKLGTPNLLLGNLFVSVRHTSDKEADTFGKPVRQMTMLTCHSDEAAQTLLQKLNEGQAESH